MSESEAQNLENEMISQLTTDDGPMNAELEGRTQAVMEQIMRAKKGNPSQFASHWEMDEEDVDEATAEQIQNDPVQRTLWAAENGNLEVLGEMLSKDPALKQCKDADGYTPLHRASYNAHLDTVKFLVEKRADIEAKTNDGWTPLHSACNWGNVEEASFLLSCGANVNAQTNGGQTPCHLTASNSPESRDLFVLLLMHANIDYSLTNQMGETARQIAERTSRHHELFKICDDSINKLR